jgi:hypothetical protein
MYAMLCYAMLRYDMIRHALARWRPPHNLTFIHHHPPMQVVAAADERLSRLESRNSTAQNPRRS